MAATLLASAIHFAANRSLGAEEKAAAAPGPKLDARPTFQKVVAPFIEKHCMDCHGGEKAKAGISFEKLKDDPAFSAQARTWERALAALRAAKMPPRTRAVPEQAEREAAMASIEAELAKLDDRGPPDPGRPTIRRLNRVEYNNTIRDLLALDFQPADDFPSDDVGYGFDNIGDVLSIPPLLLEKYLTAAEKIIEKSIVVDPITKPVLTRFAADLLRVTGPMGPQDKKGEVLLPGAEIRAKPEFPETGDYILRARVAGRKGGAEPIKIAFKVDGKDVQVHTLAAGDGAFQILEARTKFIKTGTRRFQVVFLGDAPAPKPEKNEKVEKGAPKDRKDQNEKKGGKKAAAPASGKPTPAVKKPERFIIVEYLSVEGPLDAKPKPLPESHRRIMICVPEVKNRLECARKIVESFARRVWRRPVTSEEVDRLVRLVPPGLQAGENLERAIQPALEAVLSSPHFIFKVELDRGPQDAVRSVSDHELAVRLSYFLWSSMPDEDLSARADAGDLRKSDVLAAQVKRMIEDPKSKALVENFAGQWLQVRNLKTSAPDPARFPAFDERLRADMLRETELYFEAVLREDRSILDFLDSDYTFLNERLASLYGIPGVKGEEFRRVKLTGQARGGVLTQASVLTITSNPTRTSPVKRGKWILEQVLGAPPPAPPPGVDNLNEAPEAIHAASLRQRMEQHRQKPDCASCHARMDALGFGLENYDAIGAYREKDGDFPVDASGTLPGGEVFRGPSQLKAILMREREAFTRSLVEKVLTFAVGRGMEYHDRQAVNQVAKKVIAGGFKIRTLIEEVIRSAPFQLRKSPARGESKTQEKAPPKATGPPTPAAGKSKT